jgi:hypothetical protein
MKMTGPSLPLRFGGTRPHPYFSVKADKGFRLVIKNQDQYNEFWKQFTAPILPGNWVPPMPELDFTKEMLIVSAMGQRPSSGFYTIIDGACEADGKLEIFISNLEGGGCGAALAVVTSPADAVLIPRSDLPVVFREIEISCKEWQEKYLRYK